MKKNETIALFIGLFSEMLFGASFVFIKMVRDSISIFSLLAWRNIFGLILSAILWFQLPYKVTEDMVEPEELEKWAFKPKTILIIMGVILGLSLLIAVGQLTSSFA